MSPNADWVFNDREMWDLKKITENTVMFRQVHPSIHRSIYLSIYLFILLFKNKKGYSFGFKSGGILGQVMFLIYPQAFVVAFTAGKISIECVTIFPSKYISKGAIDMKFSPDVGNNVGVGEFGPYFHRVFKSWRFCGPLLWTLIFSSYFLLDSSQVIVWPF